MHKRLGLLAACAAVAAATASAISPAAVTMPSLRHAGRSGSALRVMGEKEAKLVAEEYNDRAVQVRDGARVKVRVRALPYPIRNPRPRTSPLP